MRFRYRRYLFYPSFIGASLCVHTENTRGFIRGSDGTENVWLLSQDLESKESEAPSEGEVEHER